MPCRPLDGDKIFGDAHWAYPNSVLTTRCMAWNPQKESELYLLVHRGILRCSAERLSPFEVCPHPSSGETHISACWQCASRDARESNAGAILCIAVICSQAQMLNSSTSLRLV